MMYSEQTGTPAISSFMNGQLSSTSESSRSSIGSAAQSSSNQHPTTIDMMYLEQTGTPARSSIGFVALSHTLAQNTFLVPRFQQNYNIFPYRFTSAPSTKTYPQFTSFSPMLFPSTLSSEESSSSQYEPDNSDMKKPSGSNADNGTYTCTHHNCTLRFETPAKLQKHKHQGHRYAASQAGPHKCTHVSPKTGKPCAVIFSRPYDLTRHEGTIHDTREVKTRCPLCDRRFSRKDSLNRHLQVIHG